ncbi:hypothetical protein, partial [Streptomyces narbonensis]
MPRSRASTGTKEESASQLRRAAAPFRQLHQAPIPATGLPHLRQEPRFQEPVALGVDLRVGHRPEGRHGSRGLDLHVVRIRLAQVVDDAEHEEGR